MTRAVESLFLSWNGDARRNSWAHRVPWAVDVGEYQRDGFSYSVVDQIPVEQNYHPAPKPTVRPRASFAPTKLAGAEESVSELLNKLDFGSDNLTRMKARLKKSLDGVLIHSIFESLRFSNQISMETLKVRFGDRAGSIAAAINYVKGIKEIPMVELLKSGFAEWGFVLNEKNKRVHGRMDLWGRAGGDAWIIDYKTGDPDRVEDAFDQLAIYSLALRRFGVTENIKLGVVFPLSEQIFVRDAPAEASVVTKFFVK